MVVSDDIGNLFQRFGGDADGYQEFARDDDAKHAASRWPLVAALDISHAEPVSGARRPGRGQDGPFEPAFLPAVVTAVTARAPSTAQRAADGLPPGTVTEDSTAPAEHMVTRQCRRPPSLCGKR
jgi:hypothetical protein